MMGTCDGPAAPHPFKKGEIVEIRSFLTGFRGAWFRGEIVRISRRRSELGQFLRYLDFPDEKIKWTKLYQKYSKSKEAKQQVMVRPSYPRVYTESKLPDVDSLSEVVVAVNKAWKVGDLVDWWKDGCYWSGTLTDIKNEKCKIELLPPPRGEGSSYEGFCKDLRPSLEWTLEHGWTVPTPKGSQNCQPRARLIKPVTEGGVANLMSHVVNEDENDVQATAGTSPEYSGSTSSHFSVSPIPPTDTSRKDTKRPFTAPPSKETNSDNSKSKARDESTKVTEITGVKSSHFDSPPAKKTKTDGGILLNTMFSNEMDAAILDLEELINRIKWMKQILEHGMPLTNAKRPSWKFVEHRAPPMKK